MTRRAKWFFRGAIDGHTHLAMPFGGTISSDGLLYRYKICCLRRVLRTVFDFVLQGKGEKHAGTAVKRRDLSLQLPTLRLTIPSMSASCGTSPPLRTAGFYGRTARQIRYSVHSRYSWFTISAVGRRTASFLSGPSRRPAQDRRPSLGVHAENRGRPTTFLVQAVSLQKEKTEGMGGITWPRTRKLKAKRTSRAINPCKDGPVPPLYIVHLGRQAGALDAVIKARDEGLSDLR